MLLLLLLGLWRLSQELQALHPGLDLVLKYLLLLLPSLQMKELLLPKLAIAKIRALMLVSVLISSPSLAGLSNPCP
jgi:hypothetical protein